MISQLAYVDQAAKIGKNVTIQPFAYIEGDVEIGDNCVIMPHVSILNGTRLGKDNIVHQGTVLGAEPQDFHYTGEKSSLVIGDHNDIRENVVISRATHSDGSTRIGNNCRLMDGTHLCHDVQIGNFVVLGIKSSLSGKCVVDDYTILSTSAVLQQGCRVGSWSFIQSGCRVSKDVPPFIIMAGNPAQYHGINAVVLKNNDVHQIDDCTMRHLINAYRLVYQSNISTEDALQKIKEQIPPCKEIDQVVDFIKSSKGVI